MITAAERTDTARRIFDELDARCTTAAAHTPAASRPVPPYRRALSASALNAFSDCARKWYYRYLCNVVEDPGSVAGTYGTAFHEALEFLHKRHPRPQRDIEAQMAQDLIELLRASFAKYAAGLGSPLEAELHTRRALRTGERYIDWLVRRAAAEPFTIVGNETHATLEIAGFAFTGYIDRIDQNERDGSLSIMDYKTGGIAETAAEYRDDVAAFKEFQLPLYYWSRVAQGEEVRRLVLIPLKDPQLEIMPIELTIVPGNGQSPGRSPRGNIGIAELERSRARMGELAEQLTKTTLSEFPVTDDPSACTYCAYLDACRDRPARREDLFGN